MNLDVVERAFKTLTETLTLEGFEDPIEVLLSKRDFNLFLFNEELAMRTRWSKLPPTPFDLALQMRRIIIKERP